MNEFVHLSANFDSPLLEMVEDYNYAYANVPHFKDPPMKGNRIVLKWLSFMLILSVLVSCQKTKYQWEPGISAPKYYPVGDVKINFGNAGHGSLTNFDCGWGNEYGGVVSGDKNKDIPREVFIHYSSGAENYTYEGKVQFLLILKG